MRDEQHREVALALESLEQVEHLRLHHHVERGGRLVGDEHRGIAGERHRDHHPLPLAARELVRVVVGPARGQSDLLEQLADPRASGAAGLRRVQVDCLRDLLADLLHRVERVQRALEHDRELAPAHRAAAGRGSSCTRLRRRAAPDPRRASPAGRSRSTALAIVVFPQPDSPARPSVPAASSSNVTPRTTGTSPARVRYVTNRSRTSSRLMSLARSARRSCRSRRFHQAGVEDLLERAAAHA